MSVLDREEHAPTEETYRKITTEHGYPIDIEPLHDFTLLWIGPRTAKTLIVYACGGGYVLPAYDPHMIMMIKGYEIMKENNQDVSIVIANYGLCPTSPYPTQLRQMVLTVEHLLKSRPADNISLSGDSAGANLMTCLLLHISHPHPKVPSFSLPATQKFHSAIFISPAAAIATSTSSMHQTPQKDIVDLEMIASINAQVQLTTEVAVPNPWIAPMDAPEDWWEGLKIGKVTVVFGEGEVFKDDILIWTGRWQKVHADEVVVRGCEGELHDQPVIDLLMNVQEEREGTRLWKGWFEEFRE